MKIFALAGIGLALVLAACVVPFANPSVAPTPSSAQIPSILVRTPTSAPHLNPNGCSPVLGYKVASATVDSGTLEVTVKDANQNPVAGVTVGIEPEPVGCALMDFATGSTGVSGIVRFDNLEVGPWYVHAVKASGYGYSGPGDVTIASGSTATKTFSGS